MKHRSSHIVEVSSIVAFAGPLLPSFCSLWEGAGNDNVLSAGMRSDMLGLKLCLSYNAALNLPFLIVEITCSPIQNKQDFVWRTLYFFLDAAMAFSKLLHEAIICVEPARGVADDYISAILLCLQTQIIHKHTGEGGDLPTESPQSSVISLSTWTIVPLFGLWVLIF